MPLKESTRTFTYQTRVPVNTASEEILQACATLFSRVERHLFVDMVKGNPLNNLKSHTLKTFGITARHFNALRAQLDGRIASIKERREGQIVELQHKLKALKKHVERLQKQKPHSPQLHQKKRLLFNREKKLERLKSDQEQGRISLCFGSKKLFHAQFALKENGYQDHQEWLSEWRLSREDSFFLIGSKDETSGNQSCTATLADDGTLNLRIRLPDSLNAGKHLCLQGIRFSYGHQQIVKAIQSCQRRQELLVTNRSLATQFGVPISYRFKRDAKGWRLFVSLPVDKTPSNSSIQTGVIGLDLNADHLALVETDRFGNPITKKRIPLNTYGKDKNQAKALIGDACAKAIEFAQTKAKPLVTEKLDFQKKKAQLKHTNPRTARMLSSLSYNQIKNGLTSRGWKQGVDVLEVNPAFTSLIGRVKFAKRYGLTIHQAAALAIGRRQLQASERIPRHLDSIPDGKGGFVALSLPARNRDKHVWSAWRILDRKLKAVLAAHFRAMNNRSSSAHSACETNNPEDCRRDSDTRIRQHNCSVDVSSTIYEH